MEGGNPVITEVQQGLIKRNAALPGEDGDAIIQDSRDVDSRKLFPAVMLNQRSAERRHGRKRA
jgi:hypothetical protein